MKRSRARKFFKAETRKRTMALLLAGTMMAGLTLPAYAVQDSVESSEVYTVEKTEDESAGKSVLESLKETLSSIFAGENDASDENETDIEAETETEIDTDTETEEKSEDAEETVEDNQKEEQSVDEAENAEEDIRNEEETAGEESENLEKASASTVTKESKSASKKSESESSAGTVIASSSNISIASASNISKTVYTAEGSNFIVTVEPRVPFDEEVKLVVEEYEEGSRQYNKIKKEIMEYYEEKDMELVDFVAADIHFINKKKKEIQLDDSVSVNITFKEPVLSENTAESSMEGEQEINILHIDDDSREISDLTDVVNTEDGAVTDVEFQTDSFSVIMAAKATKVSYVTQNIKLGVRGTATSIIENISSVDDVEVNNSDSSIVTVEFNQLDGEIEVKFTAQYETGSATVIINDYYKYNVSVEVASENEYWLKPGQSQTINTGLTDKGNQPNVTMSASFVGKNPTHNRNGISNVWFEDEWKVLLEIPQFDDPQNSDNFGEFTLSVGDQEYTIVIYSEFRLLGWNVEGTDFDYNDRSRDYLTADRLLYSRTIMFPGGYNDVVDYYNSNMRAFEFEIRNSSAVKESGLPYYSYDFWYNSGEENHKNHLLQDEFGGIVYSFEFYFRKQTNGEYVLDEKPYVLTDEETENLAAGKTYGYTQLVDASGNKTDNYLFPPSRYTIEGFRAWCVQPTGFAEAGYRYNTRVKILEYLQELYGDYGLDVSEGSELYNSFVSTLDELALITIVGDEKSIVETLTTQGLIWETLAFDYYWNRKVLE